MSKSDNDNTGKIPLSWILLGIVFVVVLLIYGLSDGLKYKKQHEQKGVSTATVTKTAEK